MTGFQRALAEEVGEVVEACKGLGFHRSSLSRWRRGVQGLSVETAQALQGALRVRGMDVDLDFFFQALPSVVHETESDRDAA